MCVYICQCIVTSHLEKMGDNVMTRKIFKTRLLCSRSNVLPHIDWKDNVRLFEREHGRVRGM